jgi:hypothetical protein
VLRQTWKAIAQDLKGLLLAPARSARTAQPAAAALVVTTTTDAGAAATGSAAGAATATAVAPALMASTASASSAEPLTQRQLLAARLALEALRDFFRGEGDGLQTEDLTDLPWIQQLTALYDLPTKALIAKLFDAGVPASVRVRASPSLRG